ncbi:hypothetical protein PHLCEN_2v1708 [Hermanssonia centrifuga]|uniref:UBC core domain-containing protein n=1 Tax=Hermanssonia centrifuga TaxID=98765 RepID=A0A2R6RW32_9APHY|nr:hypothetical protein PHLCEN_2v1708 [Hermanssonia centrifuga]
MASRGGSATALRRLMTEYKQLTSQGAPDGMFEAGPISESDFFTWEALIMGPKDTPFEGGVFVAKLTFVSDPPHGVPFPFWFSIEAHTEQPSDYPLSPFKMKFEPPLFHPNSECCMPSEMTKRIIISPPPRHPLVYADGTVCISILHTPGDDPTMYEQASERWSPVQSVEKVILSVISMLAGQQFRVPFGM